MDTDEDHLVYAPSSKKLKLVEFLKEQGFSHDTGGVKYKNDTLDSTFSSFSRGELNLIVTSNLQFQIKHCAATHVCKTLNILDKKHRIMVFRAVLYGEIK